MNATFTWGSEQQQAFNEIKNALIEATALAQPDSDGEFVLDTDTQAKYGASKLEMYAAYNVFVKNHKYLRLQKFTLIVDNQALSWLKIYSADQALICRWIMALEKYHFRVEHRPRTQHCNADGLSKRTNDFLWREQRLEKLPPVAERWILLSQEEYEQLLTAPWFDVQGRVIPNHPDLPSHLRHVQPTPPRQVQRIICCTQRTKLREKQKEALQAPLLLPPHLCCTLTSTFIATIPKTGWM